MYPKSKEYSGRYGSRYEFFYNFMGFYINFTLYRINQGISVSCGIPDFRSKDIGLYNTLDCQKFGIPSPELLFDLEFFKIDPVPFYKFCRALVPEKLEPSTAHKFIALLEQKKKLLRNYTQNVDGIEKMMGLGRVVECHGSMEAFSCLNCSKRKKLDAVRDDINMGIVSYCSCGTALKPNITFFGENLPNIFLKSLDKDISKCDLVLVVGTSLKVGGSVYELLRRLDRKVPQVLINKEAVAPPASISDGFDVSLLGNCDDIFTYITSRLKWDIHSLKLQTRPTMEKVVKLLEDKTLSVKSTVGARSSKRSREDENVADDQLRNGEAETFEEPPPPSPPTTTSKKVQKCCPTPLPVPGAAPASTVDGSSRAPSLRAASISAAAKITATFSSVEIELVSFANAETASRIDESCAEELTVSNSKVDHLRAAKKGLIDRRNKLSKMRKKSSSASFAKITERTFFFK